MKKGEKIFKVWQEEEGFWCDYSSLADAVKNHEEPVEVWESMPKLLGTFRSEAVSVKARAKKKKV